MKRAISISLDAILGLHPVIEDLLQELSFPPLRAPPNSLQISDQLLLLTKSFPIPVSRAIDQTYRCLGNISLFRLLKRTLDGNTKVDCICNDSFNPESLKNRILVELIYFPAVAGPASVDLQRLYWAFLAGIQNERTSPDQADPRQFFSKLYGIDSRTLPEPPVHQLPSSVEGTEASPTTGEDQSTDSRRQPNASLPTTNPRIRAGSRTVGYFTPIPLLPSASILDRWTKARSELLASIVTAEHPNAEQDDHQSDQIKKHGVPEKLVLSPTVLRKLLLGNLDPLKGRKPALFAHECDFQKAFDDFARQFASSNLPTNGLQQLRLITEEFVQILPAAISNSYHHDAEGKLPPHSKETLNAAALSILLACPIWSTSSEDFGTFFITVPAKPSGEELNAAGNG